MKMPNAVGELPTGIGEPIKVEGNLDLSRARKKLGEAAFFLSKMTKEEQRQFPDVQRLDYYLSAFLSAGMSLRKAFHVEQNRAQNKAVQAWRNQWVAKLSPQETSLYEFLGKERNVEVHRSGSGSTRTVRPEEVDHTRDMIKSRHWFSRSAEEYVLVNKEMLGFTMEDGTNRSATDACCDYLALLRRMVAEFEAAHL